MAVREVRSAEMVIRHCTCQSAFQDQRYGRGLRAHNPAKKSNKAPAGSMYRCTVCAKKVDA